MSDVALGFAGIAVMLASIFLGAPIMLALTAIGGIGLALLTSFPTMLTILGTLYFETVSSFHFSVIPMFLLMGFFAMQAGIGSDLFDACTKWLGRLPGGLAIATTGAAAAFGAASGSSVGSAMLFTKLALPEMAARGYDRGFAAACIAIAGTLAVLIPPSALMVVYGILTNSSIGELLIAGIVPGIVFAALIGLTVMAVALWKPHYAPRLTETYTLRERLWSLRLIFPLVAVILIMIGGLYNGFFTPTEAGGIGACVTFVMAIIRNRGVQYAVLVRTLIETVTLTAMIFAIIIGGLLFARFLALSGVSDEIKGFLTGTGLSATAVLLLVTLLYLIFGMLMDAPSLLAISLPIMHPVMISLGFDPIWFGIYVVVLAEIGAVTPPVGMNCFVVKGAAGDLVSLEKIFQGLWPFLGACVLMLLLLVWFPQIALFLPQSMR
jgi:C4-dicarboxylate transporter, DctM subunit